MMAQLFGAAFGALSIILGAFGAHALKKHFNPEQQQSFETGVKYQMYHALALLLLKPIFPVETRLSYAVSLLFITGTILFSFSIYGLCLSAAFGKKLRFLGPVTPLGGLLLLAGWVVLLYKFVLIS